MTDSSSASSENSAALASAPAPAPSRIQRALRALREGRLHRAVLHRIATRLRLRARLWSLSGSRTGRRLLALWLQGQPERQEQVLAWLMHGRATAKSVEDRLNPPRSHTIDALYQTMLAQTLWGDANQAAANKGAARSTDQKGA